MLQSSAKAPLKNTSPQKGTDTNSRNDEQGNKGDNDHDNDDRNKKPPAKKPAAKKKKPSYSGGRKKKKTTTKLPEMIVGNPLMQVAFSPDGNTLVALDKSGILFQWQREPRTTPAPGMQEENEEYEAKIKTKESSDSDNSTRVKMDDGSSFDSIEGELVHTDIML